MIRKRVNTDLFLRLSIVMKDGSPANFTGAQDMKVVVWHSLYTNIRQEQTIEAEDNVISMQYTSEENQKTGRYGVSVFWSKADPKSETGRRDYAVDFTEAFTIVPYSEQEDDGTIEYIGKVNQNPDGIGAGGEVDLSDYYKKKEVDDKLKKKVDAVAGKELSECDFTKDEKDKLSGLSNYDDLELRKLVGEKADKTSVYTKQEVDSKILSSVSLVTTEEQEVGVLHYGGKDYTIYELTAELKGLPVTADQSVDIILSESPVGDNLYLKVDCLSISSDESFPVSAYEVKKVFIDKQMNSVVTIVCKETVTGEPKALLTIRYVKGLLSFDTFELSIPISELDIATADEVTVEIPALKYDKKMAFCYAMDDGKAGVHEYFFKYAKEHNLCYTDGCGSDVLYAFGNAWITYNYLGIDLHNNQKEINGMLWDNMIKMLDFGGGCYNHGGGVYDNPSITEKTDNLARQSLDDNAKAIFDKTDHFPFCVVVPGGSLDYRQPFLNVIPTNDTLYDSSSSQFQPNVVDVSTIDLSTQFQHGRLNYDTYFTEGRLNDLKTIFQEAYNAHENVVYYAFSHAPGRADLESDQQIAITTVQPFLSWIYQTYGKGGSDTVCLTSYDEIYEYLFSRKFSVLNKSIIGSNLVLKVKLASLPYFTKKDLSLILSKKSGLFTVSNVASPDSVTGLSFANRSDNTLIVNASISKRRIALAEKYTGLYEATLSNEAKEEALYMVSRLKESLQQPYLDRINAEISVPILNSISINEGEATTIERNIVVHFDVAGTITHYRIGETSDLSDIAWNVGSAKKQNYTLSADLGNKIIYVQVKNTVGESEVKSTSVILEEKPIVNYTVTGKSNNDEYGTVAPSTQEVAEGGTAHLTATANNGYLIEGFEGATSSTGVGGKSGTATVTNVHEDKIVTCNFKQVGNERAIISFGWDYKKPEIPNNGSLYDPEIGVTLVRLGSINTSTINIFNTSGGKMGSLTNTIGWTIGNEAFQGDITNNNSGIYPDDVLKRLIYKSGSLESAGMEISIPTGRYKFKILINTIKTFDLSNATYLIESGGVSQTFTLKSNYVNNFYDVSEVVIDVSGKVLFTVSTTDTKNGSLLLNAIEIEKVE